MTIKKKFIISVALCLAIFSSCFTAQTKIDRHALVTRHNVNVTSFDSLNSLSAGNGEFAFTVDATGLQTFPEFYKNGIPLGTQSQWGWHSFQNTNNYNYDETLKKYDFNGKEEVYPVEWSTPERKKDAANWFRQNSHRLHLGIIGLDIKSKDGNKISPREIKNIHQQLNLWNGEITSEFDVEGKHVEVKTLVHQNMDLVSVFVKSALIKKGQIKIAFRFPYPTGQHTDWACSFNEPEKHSTVATVQNRSAQLNRQLDKSGYFVKIDWKSNSVFTETGKHNFVLSPAGNEDEIEFSCLFSQNKNETRLPGFSATQKNNLAGWKKFWMNGGAVDLTGSTDPRADELERRIILSQYLMKIQCAGSIPPQETGLTYNSWFGKFHLEMHWWHAAHFALWNRIDLLEKSLDWYKNILPEAKKIAGRQNFTGVRWPKMVDADGLDSPSKVGPFLIWQQPHIIYFAELSYRNHHDKKTLLKYKDLVFATAEFMASFARYDKQNDRYVLGKGIIAAQERFSPGETFNTPLELAYWRWGLTTAIKWCERLHIQKNTGWQNVVDKLSTLPLKDGLYLAAEGAQHNYSNPKMLSDHPSVLGAYGMIDGNGFVDTTIMKNTLNYVWNNWNWKETWGWDYPLTAMTATRLYEPEKAIDALFKNEKTNTYLLNGHNYQDGRLRLYLPGNGGLLSAVAMMCAGFDGNKIMNPGFPKNGKWQVKWENLSPLF
jgi:protein-glucosylgalactosylhydroxylysine glucosidase